MTQIARLYGGSMYDLAAEEQLTDTVLEQMQTIRQLFRENPDPTDEEILEYLSGNLCRCSGFVGQTRSILKFLDYKKGQEEGK